MKCILCKHKMAVRKFQFRPPNICDKCYEKNPAVIKDWKLPDIDSYWNPSDSQIIKHGFIE